MSKYYCTVHNREATHKDSRGYPRCDMSLGGITMPCKTASLSDAQLKAIEACDDVKIYGGTAYCGLGDGILYKKIEMEELSVSTIKGFVVEGSNE